MKSKGAVKFFAIALAVVCLFQLSFTFISDNFEKKADNWAKTRAKSNNVQKAQLKRHYIDSVGRKTIFSIGIKKYTYQDVKERALNLGLDLRGGMHVTLEVEMNDLIKELSNQNPDPAFNQALGKAKELQKTTQTNYVDLFAQELTKIKPGVKLAPYFNTLANQGHVDPNSSNDKVIAYLKEESQSALDRTYEIIRSRIDKFGVTQPNIQKDNNTGRIIVELPGADDPERVRKYLQGSAHLEFYTTYTLGELGQYIIDADQAYYDKLQEEKGVKVDSVMDTATKKMVVKKNPKRDQPLISALRIPNDKSIYASPIAGFVPIADTPKVNKILAREEVRNVFPTDVKFAWNAKPEGDGKDIMRLVALKTSGIAGKEAVLTGDVITDAKKDLDPQTHTTYEVVMQMNSEGASDWASITKDNVGKFIAIVLDNQVYSAPRVNGEISGGRSSISGNFTANESADLANILKAGKLPVRVQIIEEAIVGPSLGQAAISSGLLSLLAGLLAVIIFMVLYYSRSGWVANLALLINLFFIIGVLTSLNAALTLPGMAGIVLTLAMAVDANVLIYERIRDELLEGKGMKIAISEGFKHALSSIVDGNIVTLLIGIILMAFGTGPIYGFAVVLVIGILTSLFTSILITRLMFDWLLEKDKKINFGSKGTTGFLRNINYDFVGKRKTFYIISSIVFLIGVASLLTRGLNYGVDFKGGRTYVVAFDKSQSATDVRSALTVAFDKLSPEVKTFGDDKTLNITTDWKAEVSGDEANKEVQTRLMSGLEKYKDAHPKILSSQQVGSTIASDIKQSAFGSILFSLLVIFIYIVLRFKRWQFALGATVALIHDVVFVLTAFSLFKDIMPFSLSVDQAIVAALLTICGYSMNDTVVVFDRIREYLGNNKKSAMIPTINDAINKTLSRTVITSFTIFMVVLVLFIFGGEVIKGFAFAMLLGIIIGTYSSIFVATPIVIDFHRKDEKDFETSGNLATANRS